MSIRTGRFGPFLAGKAGPGGTHRALPPSDRWLADFAKLDIRDEIRSKVLKTNARKLLNI
jgi:hypothetical protein